MAGGSVPVGPRFTENGGIRQSTVDKCQNDLETYSEVIFGFSVRTRALFGCTFRLLGLDFLLEPWQVSTHLRPCCEHAFGEFSWPWWVSKIYCFGCPLFGYLGFSDRPSASRPAWAKGPWDWFRWPYRTSTERGVGRV